jgi:hypothetical protein
VKFTAGSKHTGQGGNSDTQNLNESHLSCTIRRYFLLVNNNQQPQHLIESSTLL